MDFLQEQRSNKTTNQNNALVGVKSSIIQKLLHNSGYPAEVIEGDNYCLIKSVSNGTRYQITLSQPNKVGDAYMNLSFVARYDSEQDVLTSIEHMNCFNKLRRFIKGYVEEDGNMVVRVDWFLNQNIAEEQISTWIDLWKACLVLFESFWEDHAGLISID
jgi:hypothetical protein